MKERHDIRIYLTYAKFKAFTRHGSNIVLLPADFTDNGVSSLISLFLIAVDCGTLHFDREHLQTERFIFC